MRSVLLMWIVASVSILFAETTKDYERLAPGEKKVAEATIFYSAPFLFDYDKDGTRNKVVMGAKLFVKKTKKGYKGYMVRGLYDIESKKPIAYYESTLIMHPPSDIAIEDIVVRGKTVRFKAGPFRYVFKDGGKGIMQDEVVVMLKERRKHLRLYGGDIEIFNNAKEV